MPPEEVDNSVQTPADFAAYEKARMGQTPEPEVETPAEGTEEPTKTEPDPEPEDHQEQEPEPAKEPEVSSANVQKRIDKAVAKQREAERKAAELEQRLAQLQGSRPATKDAPPVTAEGKPVPPDPNNWTGNWEELEAAKLEYLEKLQDWKLDQRDRTRAQAETQKATQSAWKTRVEAAKAEHEDFEEVMAGANVPVPAAMQDAIVTSEHGAELIYFLAQNPAETERIAALSPIAAARELGKLEARFEKSATPEDKKPTVSRAPKPPKPVRGSGGAPPPKLDGDIPFADYERLRLAEHKRG